MTAVLELGEAQRQARRRVRDEARADDSGHGTPGRSAIRIVASEMPRVVDEAERALIDAGSPIFVRAGRLVEPIQEDALATGGRRTIVGRIRDLCLDSLLDLLGRVVTFERYVESRHQWVKTDPPRWVASMLLARDGHWRLPPLAGVITTPTLRPDGSLLAEAGYDPATRLFLFLDARFQMPRVEAHPTRADAERALALLTDLLVGFPFVGAVDKAVALSGMLTTVVRPSLPVAPLHAIRAHTPGTGKSYLIDLFSAIATGRPCPAMAAGKTEEETEKRLAARLLQANPIISIDNVNGELGGDMLCQMTERAVVCTRILGTSEAPDVECRAMVFANGNNLVLVGDMTRRTVLCGLDAHIERPETRSFSFNPIERVIEDRGRYVAAVLTIIRAYRAAGSPRVCTPLGSYGAWSDTVRSALVWLGQADPVASMETTRAEDPELAALRELLEHWREHFRIGQYYGATAIIEKACEKIGGDNYSGEAAHPLFYELVVRMTNSRTPKPSAVSLGKWLQKLRGRVSGGLRMETKQDEKRGCRYAVFDAPEDDPT